MYSGLLEGWLEMCGWNSGCYFRRSLQVLWDRAGTSCGGFSGLVFRGLSPWGWDGEVQGWKSSEFFPCREGHPHPSIEKLWSSTSALGLQAERNWGILSLAFTMSAWGWVEPAGQIHFLVHCAYIKISSWEQFLELLLFHCLLFTCLTDSKYFCQKNLPFLARTSKFVSLVASWNVSGCVLIVNVCLLLVGLMKCLLNSRNFPDEACYLIWFYWRCGVLVQPQRACILSVIELPKMPGRIVLRGRRLKHTF